jgi:hypothetical protein
VAVLVQTVVCWPRSRWLALGALQEASASRPWADMHADLWVQVSARCRLGPRQPPLSPLDRTPPLHPPGGGRRHRRPGFEVLASTVELSGMILHHGNEKRQVTDGRR